MDLVQRVLLPDRFRRTEVHALSADGPLRKTYHHFDSEKLRGHFEWLISLNAPFLPKILDIRLDIEQVAVTMARAPGVPLWEVLRSDGADAVLGWSERILALLLDFSRDTYVGPLPPGYGLVHSDFHMANIFVTPEDGGFQLIDLENIGLGSSDRMRRQIRLDILGARDFDFEHQPDEFERLVRGLPLEARTVSRFMDECEDMVARFYDDYREQPGYFEREQGLRAALVRRMRETELTPC